MGAQRTIGLGTAANCDEVPGIALSDTTGLL